MSEATDLAELLTAGRRVLIRLSPECGAEQWARGVNNSAASVRRRGHHPAQDGRTGIVVRWNSVEALPGHTFGVRYDEPYEEKLRGHIRVHIGGFFAAYELVPLAGDGSEILHPALAKFER